MIDQIYGVISIGYEVKTRPLKIRIDGTAKGDWDIGLVIDALSMRDKIDAMVLISGDGDFVDLLKAFKSYGVRVEVVSFPHTTAQELRSFADVYHPLNENILLRRKE